MKGPETILLGNANVNEGPMEQVPTTNGNVMRSYLSFQASSFIVRHIKGFHNTFQVAHNDLSQCQWKFHFSTQPVDVYLIDPAQGKLTSKYHHKTYTDLLELILNRTRKECKPLVNISVLPLLKGQRQFTDRLCINFMNQWQPHCTVHCLCQYDSSLAREVGHMKIRVYHSGVS